MIDLLTGAPEPVLITFVRQWFKLMAIGRAKEACDLIDAPNGYGIRWTPGSIKLVVEEIFGPGSRFRARNPDGLRWTDPDELGAGGHPEVYRFDDGSGYALEHDVPLNGEWSDLTAHFEFHRRPLGYSVVLHDLHVL